MLGEYQLNQLADQIAADELIQMKMMGPYVDESFIKRKNHEAVPQRLF